VADPVLGGGTGWLEPFPVNFLRADEILPLEAAPLSVDEETGT